MKIQELELRNFSSHADSRLVFDKPIALIVGPLNAGKSSILQAIEYVLCGECGYHRKRTDNKSELVRGAGQYGAMEASVVLPNGTASRVRNGLDNVETMEWCGATQATASAMDASVAAAAGTRKGLLSALFNTSGFFNLEEPEQKEIIIGLIGAEVTDAKVRSAWTGEAAALPMIKGPVTSVTALDNAYKYCFDRRTMAKRELAELKPVPAPDGPEPPVDRIKEKLGRLENELQIALMARSRLEGAAAAVSGRQAIEQEIQSIEAATRMPLERPDATMKAMQQWNQTQKEAVEAVKRVSDEVVDLRVQLETVRTNIDLLTAFNGRCVAGDHACPAHMSDMKAAKAQQEAKVPDILKTLVDAENRLKELQRIRDDRSEFAKLEEKMRDLQYKTNEQTRQLNRLADLKSELDKDQPVIPNDEIARLETAANELRERISKGKTQLEAAQSWIERDRQVKAAAAGRAKLETEVRYLEELCTFLGPKGVRLALIDEKIGKFVNQIQSYLQPFGFEIALTVDPWLIAINGQPVKRLSSSERYRLSVAFQVAIAKMSGVNMVMCDGAEILTPPIFAQMMGMLANAGLDQVIVLKTLMQPVEQFLAARKPNPAIDCFVVTNTDGVSSVETLS